jgi:putative ABC transport system permease protein
MNAFIAFAFKNVFRQKKRSVTLGINYTIVTLILALLLAFSAGAKFNIESNLVLSTAGHITISGQYVEKGRIYSGIKRTGDIESIVLKTLPGSSILVRYRINSSLYYKGLSKRLSFVGIDAKSETGFRGQMNFVSGSWEEFASDPNGVILPKETADYYGIASGDEAVISTRSRFGAFNTGTLHIRGIYRTDNFFFGGLVLGHFDFFRNLDLAASDASSTIYVYLPSTAGLSGKRALLLEALGKAGFVVSTPKTDADAIDAVAAASTTYRLDAKGHDRLELTLATIDEVTGIVRTLLAAVDGVGGLVAAIMLFIIAVSIMINLRMTINERLREIGTMRAMGMRAGGVTGLFMLENGFLALIFSLIGVLLALVVVALFSFAITLPSGGNLGLFLEAGHLVLIPEAGSLALIVSVIVSFSVLFSWFPARRAGRISPVEAFNDVF